MTQEEVLVKINEIIENERGTPLGLDDRLIDSGLDSFGFSIFWLSLSNEFPDIPLKDKIEMDDLELKASDFIDFILKSKP